MSIITFNDFLTEKKSPYKKETLEKYKKKWKKGEKIPFGIEASLKAQGMIPRADGSYQVSDEYKEEGMKPQKGVVDKHITPETKAPETHRERIEKKIHKAEKEKLKKIKKPERILSHPDPSHKGNPEDNDFEGNIKKTKIEKSIKKSRVRPFKKKPKKYYNPKAKISEGTIPTFDEFINDLEDVNDIQELIIEGAVPSYDEFKNINESLTDIR